MRTPTSPVRMACGRALPAATEDRAEVSVGKRVFVHGLPPGKEDGAENGMHGVVVKWSEGEAARLLVMRRGDAAFVARAGGRKSGATWTVCPNIRYIKY